MVLATWWFDDRQPSLDPVRDSASREAWNGALSPVRGRETTTRNAVRCVLVTYASPRRDAGACCSACECGKWFPTAHGPAPGSLTPNLRLKQPTLPTARIAPRSTDPEVIAMRARTPPMVQSFAPTAPTLPSPGSRPAEPELPELARLRVAARGRPAIRRAHSWTPASRARRTGFGRSQAGSVRCDPSAEGSSSQEK